MILNYLSKNAFRNQIIKELPKNDLGLIVVIPAHDETSLISTIESLAACSKPIASVEIIVVFNASETSTTKVIKRNIKAKEAIENWCNTEVKKGFELFTIEENYLPKKHAGVGLARKIGMDEAARRFESVNNPNGIIACFDADSKCEPDYLQEIENHFKKHPKIAACSIYFEHPTSGVEFEADIYDGIRSYEMHLRYYKNGLAYAGLPYAFHTIGSSMAVKVKDYCKEGGMNRRKAGEDFYFLQKFISNNTLNELNSTKIIPSPRPSHRVPFGTGRAIQEMIDAEREIHKTYDFETFEIMRDCFQKVSEWFINPPNFNKYLLDCYGEQFLIQKVEEIRSQSSDLKKFEKRFFQWFSAFQALKFAHFLRDNYLPIQPLENEVKKLLMKSNSKLDSDLLEQLRRIDRKS
jgi:hypothetical protein